jgi:hypothetical protein
MGDASSEFGINDIAQDEDALPFCTELQFPIILTFARIIGSVRKQIYTCRIAP